MNFTQTNHKKKEKEKKNDNYNDLPAMKAQQKDILINQIK